MTTYPQSAVRFIHLSDIHFTAGDSEIARNNEDLRHLILSAAQRIFSETGPIQAVLVGGDVAYHGLANEFDVAADWLKQLTTIVGCPESNVWVVPGNHDVDRTVYKKSTTLQTIHAGIRAGGQHTPEPGTRLTDNLLDATGGPALLAPLEAYNDFASRYGCDITPAKLHWEQKLTLNDGSDFIIRGLSSAVMSTDADSIDVSRLVLPRSECQVRPRADASYVLLCHHPFDWLCDSDEIERTMLGRAKILLFGHKHFFQTRQIEQTLVIGAGAVHPDRNEKQWDPRFNVITAWVPEDGGTRKLAIAVTPFVWRGSSQSFQAEWQDNGERERVYELALQDWVPNIPPEPMSAVDETESRADEMASATLLGRVAAESPVNPSRQLVYRFMSLNYLKRLEIVQTLGLVEDIDEGKPSRELYKLYFRRAERSGLLAKLWDAVEAAHPDSNLDNPFNRPSSL